jgi:excisionase family DNA binding protein
LANYQLKERQMSNETHVTAGEGSLRLDDFGEVLTVEEVAAVLRIGRRLAYEQARSGALPVLKMGRRMLVPREALRKHLARAGEG